MTIDGIEVNDLLAAWREREAGREAERSMTKIKVDGVEIEVPAEYIAPAGVRGGRSGDPALLLP